MFSSLIGNQNKSSLRKRQQHSKNHDMIIENSNVRPYVISEHTMFKSKRNNAHEDTPQLMPYYQTKYVGTNNRSRGQSNIALPEEKVPIIKNVLHLDLPQNEKPTIRTYRGQEEEYESQWKKILQKICGCCMRPSVQTEYEDCDYCDRRVYKNKGQNERKGQNEWDSDESEETGSNTPYISSRRIKIRQKQPINTYYQDITNENIINNRHETHIQF